MNGTEIRPARPLSVSVCKPKLRLFVGNIPKLKGRDELYVEFDKRTCKYLKNPIYIRNIHRMIREILSAYLQTKLILSWTEGCNHL